MDLDKIVSELVEKRFKDTVMECIERVDETDSYNMGELKDALHKKICSLVKEEVEKREEEIRKLIVERINTHINAFQPKISVSMGNYY